MDDDWSAIVVEITESGAIELEEGSSNSMAPEEFSLLEEVLIAG